MTDWTTCLVVRVPGSGLWERMSDHRALDQWAMLGSLGATLTAEQLADSFPGEFTPVLDADGLPVVRAVGDLTARHIGKRVRVRDDVDGDTEGVLAALDIGATVNPRLVDVRVGEEWVLAPIDTPVEVLP